MSFSLSNISGSQIQKDSFINNLTVACDPGLLAPKNLNGLPNPLNLEKRDGKSAIAVDICCLDLACLNVTEKLTVNDATFNTITTAFLTANNASIDTLEGRVVNLKASNAVGAPGGAAKLTIGDTAVGDAMGGDTAIEIVGTNPSVNAIDLSTGGDITLKPQGAGPLNTSAPPDLTVYISSGSSGQPTVNGSYNIQPTGGGTGVGGQVSVTTDGGGNVTAMTAVVGGGGYVVGETYATTTPVAPNVTNLTFPIEFVLPATSVDGPPGGILRAYQIEAQFISGSIQGQPLVFAPNLAQINGITQATSSGVLSSLNVNYLEISNGSGAPGAIVGAGNTTGTPDAGGNIINILNPVFIESQASQGLLVAGGIQAGSGPAFAGAYGFQVSNQGAISAPSATITGVVQTETLNVNGNTTLGDGVGGDTLTVNAVSTFNDEVTIDNQLAVTSLSELSNVEITGSLLQSGGIVTLAGPNVTVNTSLTVNGGLLQANAGLEVNNVLLTANAGLTVVGTSTLATTNIATLTVAGTSALIGQVTVTNNLILLPTSTLEIQNTNFNAFGVGTPGLPNAVQVSGGVGIGATLWVTQGIRSNGNINTTGNITASLNIKGSFIESTGNLLVGATLNTSTLNVTTGTTTLGGDLTVTDMATFNGGVTVPNTAAVGIGNAPGAPGTLSVQNLSTFTGGIATNSLGVIGGGTSVSITGNVDILSSGELTVDSITSNAGSGLVILPATGQNVNIQPNGVGSEVNITGSNIGITSGFKVANTGPMTAPVNAGDPGTLGDIRWGTDTGVRYLYICIAANTWERVALAPW